MKKQKIMLIPVFTLLEKIQIILPNDQNVRIVFNSITNPLNRPLYIIKNQKVKR